MQDTSQNSTDPDAREPKVDPDTESDPGLDDGSGSGGDSTDWTGEGGATEDGPATDSPAP